MILLLGFLVAWFAIYFIFNPAKLLEMLQWDWNKLRDGFLWLYNWLKGLSK